MMTMKFVQLVGNTAVRTMQCRYPALTIRFFAGKAGGQMRMFIGDPNDPRQLTGRLYDLGETPALQTLRVRALAEMIEKRMEAEIREFLRIRAGG